MPIAELPGYKSRVQISDNPTKMEFQIASKVVSKIPYVLRFCVNRQVFVDRFVLFFLLPAT